jgi:hypothetical protein
MLDYHIGSNQPEKAFVIVCILREGAAEAFQFVEDSLYPPGTPKNDLFNLVFVGPWPKNDLLWPLVSFPLEDLEKVRDLLQVSGFKLACGTPRMMLFGEGGAVLVSLPDSMDSCKTPSHCQCTDWVHFPMAHADNVFTLEGRSENKIHPQFTGRVAGST